MKDFTNNRWIAVRYFDSNLNQMGTIRSAKYDGINYNVGHTQSMRSTLATRVAFCLSATRSSKATVTARSVSAEPLGPANCRSHTPPP